MSSLTDASSVTASEQEALVSSSVGRANFSCFSADFYLLIQKGGFAQRVMVKARTSGEDGLSLMLQLWSKCFSFMVESWGWWCRSRLFPGEFDGQFAFFKWKRIFRSSLITVSILWWKSLSVHNWRVVEDLCCAKLWRNLVIWRFFKFGIFTSSSTGIHKQVVIRVFLCVYGFSWYSASSAVLASRPSFPEDGSLCVIPEMRVQNGMCTMMIELDYLL